MLSCHCVGDNDPRVDDWIFDLLILGVVGRGELLFHVVAQPISTRCQNNIDCSLVTQVRQSFPLNTASNIFRTGALFTRTMSIYVPKYEKHTYICDCRTSARTSITNDHCSGVSASRARPYLS
jgi:hypothetical protein